MKKFAFWKRALIAQSNTKKKDGERRTKTHFGEQGFESPKLYPQPSSATVQQQLIFVTCKIVNVPLGCHSFFL